nr:hypothetical protein [Tanacetum cinerariifolium]
MSDLRCCGLEHHQGKCRKFLLQFIHVELWCHELRETPTIPDYVSSLEEPKQASLSPNYVPGPKYPEYLALSDEEVLDEDQPYAAADSPIALSLGYIAGSDPKEDPEDELEDGPTDYLADKGDDDHDSSGDDADDEEEKEASEEDEDEEEH